MQRYFVSKKEENSFIMGEADSYHIVKVMRMKIGNTIEVVYNNMEYLCKITAFTPNVKCEIIEIIEGKKRKIPRVSIAQSLVKEQKMDYILQKSTELGVEEIIPISTERSIIKVEEKEKKKLERWKKVVKEASEQSKRSTIPVIKDIKNINSLINEKYDYKLVCSVNEKSKTIKSILSKVNISDTILFVIGPEGGLSKKEEEILLENGFQAVTLGDNILRTETASLFVLSVINYEFMR